MLSLVEYDEYFLDASWKWLNDQELKKLVMVGEFSKEQQTHYYESLKCRDDYKVWGIKYEETPIGVVGLKNISNNSAEYFGYIGEKAFWNKGLSRCIFFEIEQKMLDMNINKLWLNVSIDNERAIMAYLKNGFVEIKKTSDTLTMEKCFDI
ncbi:TPA: GNAT family N-acetyltransferase [Vibrio vulnificus]|nr:GNAT family N-acetyltransferase [Vibrio vulnificus]